MTQARITRVRLENYKSIKFCDVKLEPITVLVGQNGSGKSNFLDALVFTRDLLLQNLDFAIQERGNFFEIARKEGVQQAPSFSVLLEVTVGQECLALYYQIAFEEKPIIKEQYLKNEQGEYLYKIAENDILINSIHLIEHLFTSHLGISVKSDSDVNVKGLVNVFLLLLQFLNPIPEHMRPPQNPNFFNWFKADGSNMDSVYQKLEQGQAQKVRKIKHYLGLVNPDIIDIEVNNVSNYLLVDFLGKSSRFNKSAASDGTLSAWALITALFYCDDLKNSKLLADTGCILILEEPEAHLYPTALEILLILIRQVVPTVQILLSTHSPVLLEKIELASGKEKILVVETFNGETIIDEIDTASRNVVHKKLFDLGELLTMNQLEPKAIAGKAR